MTRKRQQHTAAFKAQVALAALKGNRTVNELPSQFGVPGHRVYPYLLRDVRVERPDQVSSTDITYVPLASGFMYQAAVLDWYSRYVLAWRLSNTLDGWFCLETLDEALGRGGTFRTTTPSGRTRRWSIGRRRRSTGRGSRRGRRASGQGVRRVRAAARGAY